MFKRFSAFVFVLWLGAASPARSMDTLGYEYTRSTGSFNTIASATVGFRFTVTEPVLLTALGVVDTDSAGLLSSHEVGLWTESGSLLVAGTVPAGAIGSLAGGFRFTSVQQTLLSPGINYLVAATFDINSFEDTWVQAPSITAPSQIMLLDAGATYSAPGTSLAFPTDRTLPGSAAANFLFTSPVPEVSTLASFGLGLACLGYVIRIRKRTAHVRARGDAPQETPPK